MFRRIAAIVLVFALAAAPIIAQSTTQQGQSQQQSQIELEDGELQEFVSALQAVQQVQSNAQSKMQKSLEDEGLSQKRFQEIYQAQQNPNQSGNADVSDQEQQKFDSVMQTIRSIQQNTRSKITQAIKDEDLSVQRFNAIYKAVQQRPELQQQVQSMMQQSG